MGFSNDAKFAALLSHLVVLWYFNIRMIYESSKYNSNNDNLFIVGMALFIIYLFIYIFSSFFRCFFFLPLLGLCIGHHGLSST